MSNEHEKLVAEAERKIAAILGRLEIDTDMLLETIAVHDIEVTCVSDTRKQIQRRVAIEMRRSPGSNWGQ